MKDDDSRKVSSEAMKILDDYEKTLLEKKTRPEVKQLIVDKNKGSLLIFETTEEESGEPKGNITIPKIKLRSKPIEKLTKDAVEIMVKDRGFYDVEMNASGTGFPHKYELQKGGKVVYDHTSGLMWQQSGSSNYMSYRKAKAYVETLNSQNFASYHDWRLPTLEEAMSLMESTKKNGNLYIDPLFDSKQQWIWTSDIPTGFWASSAWVVAFCHGDCLYGDFSYDDVSVRAVR